MDSLPLLRPSRCGEMVAVCCVLVRVGMCRRVGKQAVIRLVNSRGEGPFILVWCLRFTVLFSLSPLCAAGISFLLTLLSSLAHWHCLMLSAGCPGLRG